MLMIVTDTLITEEISGILKKDNLNVNDDKTEKTILYV